MSSTAVNKLSHHYLIKLVQLKYMKLKELNNAKINQFNQVEILSMFFMTIQIVFCLSTQTHIHVYMYIYIHAHMCTIKVNKIYVI